LKVKDKLLHTWKVLFSNLGLETNYPEFFFIFLVSPIHYFKFGHDHFHTLAKS